MSQTDQLFGQQYQALCAQLGDLVSQRDSANERIYAVQKQIAALNTSAPLANKAEAAALAEQATRSGPADHLNQGDAEKPDEPPVSPPPE